jgi:hypothetical protein
MGTFYRDRTREFKKKCLVLCEYLHRVKGEQVHDVIMISVDCDDEIHAEFNKHCKILDRRNVEFLAYLPECNEPHFDYRVDYHG